MMGKSVLFIPVILIGLITALFAQQVKKKKPVQQLPTDSTIVTEPDPTFKMDLPNMDTSTATRYYLFPEFYSYWPIEKIDTIIRYQCYDGENSYVNVDTLHDINDVQHIQFVKTYTNFLHTYIDPDGKPRPSSASKIIYRYDKVDDDTWKSYDVSSGYVAELKEFKNTIVRTDTTTIVNVNGSKHLTIRKYYKIVETKKQGEIEQEK